MTPFFITTAFIPRICFIILYSVAVVYLLSLRRKAPSTWWLVSFFTSMALIDLGWDLNVAIPISQMSDFGYHLMFLLGQGLMIPMALSYLQFAYAIQGNPYPREARALLWAGGAVSAGVVATILSYPDYVASPVLMQVQIGVMVFFILMVLWAIGVFIRKALAFSRAAAERTAAGAGEADGAWDHWQAPRSRAARACRAFARLTLLFLAFAVSGFLAWGLGVMQAYGELFFNLSYIAFVYGLFVAYVNYAPEVTSVQAKLIGASLVTTLLLFVVLARTVYTLDEVAEESGLAAPLSHTVQFEPDGLGGYVARSLPMQWDAALGDTLAVPGGMFTPVMLPFPFPFYGDSWQRLYVSDDGLVTAEAVPGGPLAMLPWKGVPFIAPLGFDLDPSQGGAVYVKAAAEAVTVTWDGLALAGRAARHTVQLVLRRSGVIEFRYAAPGGGPVVGAWYKAGLRGLSPGGKAVPQQPLPRSFSGAISVAAGTAIVEDYGVQLLSHSARHGRKLFYLVIGATLFILFVFPYVFRSNLLRPLDRLLAGVQQVEAGQTAALVAVEAQDEIGTLTQHFNAMAHAVHEAETQLQAYAETLEEKVTDRTAALQRSLDELKAAQARLVQAEKMASLGALTAGIAHEIKNPLNFVNNFAELNQDLFGELEEALAQGEPVGEVLDDLRANMTAIARHGHRADAIVQAMMAHASGGEGERQQVEINPLVEKYIGLAYHGKRAKARELNVQIERSLSDEVGEVEIVPQDIGRVLLNLLTNAFDAVHARSLQADDGYMPTVRVSTERAGGRLLIRVEDNGVGIAPEGRDRIFEPFYTTKAAGQGTGLGLSLSYDIITHGHGGTLTVEGVQGQGAAFLITLPDHRRNGA